MGMGPMRTLRSLFEVPLTSRTRIIECMLSGSLSGLRLSRSLQSRLQGLLQRAEFGFFSGSLLLVGRAGYKHKSIK